MSAKFFNQVVLVVITLFAVAFSLKSGASSAGAASAAVAVAATAGTAQSPMSAIADDSQFFSASGEGRFTPSGQLERGI